MSLDFLFKKVPSKIVWSITFIVVALLFFCLPLSASAASLTVEQSGVDLVDLAAMVWAAKDGLPWYQLLVLTSFLLVPLASLFTSITPTPKQGTLWSFVYSYIEAAALTFYKAKDKPVDTLSRRIDGRPVDAINDSMGKLALIGGLIDQTVKITIFSRASKLLKKLF